MLKAFVEKIIETAAPKTFEVDGSVFSSKELVHVMDKKPMPKCIGVTGLDSICKLVKNEAEHVGLQIFVQVKDHKNVSVFTALDDDEDRLYLYNCTADTPGVTMGRFISYENAVIELRSLYIPNDGTVPVGGSNVIWEVIENITFNIEYYPSEFGIRVRMFAHDAVPATVSIKNIGLYIGEYTTETLPEYQPKEYGAELAECQRYYQIRSTNDISAADMRPLMRLTNPTITAVSDGYSYSADLSGGMNNGI